MSEKQLSNLDDVKPRLRAPLSVVSFAFVATIVGLEIKLVVTNATVSINDHRFNSLYVFY